MTKCLIWGTSARAEPRLGDYEHINSRRAGGEYKMPGRCGVYFETGFAMGLNLPIVWTCKDTSMRDLHFDTRQFPHIVWTNSEDLYKQLRARIGALIGQGPNKRG